LCFQKRKKGLLKKAAELSKLTDCQIIMTIIDSKGETVNTYKSFEGSIEDKMRKVTEHHAILSNDVSKQFAVSGLIDSVCV
jgi:predicted urease superfamily metal-dependent hydrolase